MGAGLSRVGSGVTTLWVLVKGFNVSYQNNEETVLFTIDPYYSDLN